MNIIIIGAGASGCFAAIEIKRTCPEAEVTILEKGKRPLAKVAITGGGRCNLTNSFAQVVALEHVYPRGFRLMKKLFHHFSYEDTYQWFENEGVALVTQEDECVFPQSQDAMEIVNTLVRLMRINNVRVITEAKALKIEHDGETSEGEAYAEKTSEKKAYKVKTSKGNYTADKVLVTVGGQPLDSGYDMLEGLNLDIVPSLPSLFSFCLADKGIKELMGTVVEEASVSLVGTKLKSFGPLLITHWGVSGPAVLKLSSYGARLLAEKDYKADISIRWIDNDNDDIMDNLKSMANINREKKLSSVYPTELNSRLWNYLLERSRLSPDMRWKELRDKDYNRLLNTLTNDVYKMTGKNRFKDEFVTCGGVSLNNLHHDTLESKQHPGLYFAGEATDVDAVTGGFNLQAAWTMGYVAAHGICND